MQVGSLLKDESIGDWLYEKRDMDCMEIVRELGMDFATVFQDGIKPQRVVADLYMMFGESQGWFSKGIEQFPGEADEGVVRGLKIVGLLDQDDGMDQATAARRRILENVEGVCAVRLDEYFRGLSSSNLPQAVLVVG